MDDNRCTYTERGWRCKVVLKASKTGRCTHHQMPNGAGWQTTGIAMTPLKQAPYYCPGKERNHG